VAKKHIPNSVDAVFDIMKQYVEKKGFNFTDSRIKFLAENYYLYFESRGWEGIKYWPPLAMKWILNEKRSYAKRNEGKFNKENVGYKKPEPQGKSIRDKIMEQENDE
jgi:hypothetical protein